MSDDVNLKPPDNPMSFREWSDHTGYPPSWLYDDIYLMYFLGLETLSEQIKDRLMSIETDEPTKTSGRGVWLYHPIGEVSRFLYLTTKYLSGCYFPMCPMSEWIKCSERLPDKFVDVLVYVISSGRSVHENGINCFEEPYFAIDRLCVWCDGAPTSFRTQRFEYGEITHWMPLPSSPVPEPPNE